MLSIYLHFIIDAHQLQFRLMFHHRQRIKLHAVKCLILQYSGVHILLNPFLRCQYLKRQHLKLVHSNFQTICINEQIICVFVNMVLFCAAILIYWITMTYRITCRLFVSQWIQNNNNFWKWFMCWLRFISINYSFGTIVPHQAIYSVCDKKEFGSVDV